MSRSIHTTRRDLHDLERSDYSDSEERARQLERLRELVRTKRRIKGKVAADRQREEPTPPTPVDAIPMLVRDESPYAHYPASADDIRAIMQLLPTGALDGLTSVELCLDALGQKPRQPAEVYRDEADPLTGRTGVEVLPGVFSAPTMGTYSPRSQRMRLYAYVYDPRLPDRAMWECYLRLCMLSTFVHEAAHHYDFSQRVARGRWRMDGTDKAEIYAEAVQHEWIQRYVIPYVRSTYQKAVQSLEEWITHHGGMSIRLEDLVDDPRVTANHSSVNLEAALFSIYSALGYLARDVAEGKEADETRLGFANSLHYGACYEPALLIVAGLLRENPHNLGALTLRADIYEHQGRHRDARELAEHITGLDPTREDAWWVLVDACESAEDWGALLRASAYALEHLDMSVWRQIDMAFNHALACLELGNVKEMERDLGWIDGFEWESGEPPRYVQRRMGELRRGAAARSG